MAKARKPRGFEAYYIYDEQIVWGPDGCELQGPKDDYEVDGKKTALLWLPDPKNCMASAYAKRGRQPGDRTARWYVERWGWKGSRQPQLPVEAKLRQACWGMLYAYRPANNQPWKPFAFVLWSDFANRDKRRSFHQEMLDADRTSSHWKAVHLVPALMMGQIAKATKCAGLLRPAVKTAARFRNKGMDGAPVLRAPMTPKQAVEAAKEPRERRLLTDWRPGDVPYVKPRKNETPAELVKRVLSTSTLRPVSESKNRLVFATRRKFGVIDDNHAMAVAAQIAHVSLPAAYVEGDQVFLDVELLPKRKTKPKRKAAKAKAKPKAAKPKARKAGQLSLWA